MADDFGSIKNGWRTRTATCVICGKEFETRSSSAKYCSDDCYNEGQRIRKAKRAASGKRPNKPKPDIYCPVRSAYAETGDPTKHFTAGRQAVDAVQSTSTRLVGSHGKRY